MSFMAGRSTTSSAAGPLDPAACPNASTRAAPRTGGPSQRTPGGQARSMQLLQYETAHYGLFLCRQRYRGRRSQRWIRVEGASERLLGPARSYLAA